MKRYRYLIPLGILFLGVLIYCGTYRIISINIGDKGEVTTDYFDIENTIDLFDITQVHEIKVLMTEEEYKDMIDTYSSTSEKDWYKTDVIIDGVLVSDVGVRLKGNGRLKRIEGNVVNYNERLPLLIKFNKYVDQTYQGHSMIVLRVGGAGNIPFLSEPYAYKLYQRVGQPAPEISHGLVEINGRDMGLFIVSELVEDDYYIQKWFGSDNGVLYKAGNFVYFGYLGEDPMLYSGYFMQRTRVNDYDLYPLIRMLKFVTESDDKEFINEIDNYIDVKSVLTSLAIDDFLCNLDTFGGNGSNFYLYYNLGEKKFYLLTWDQDVAIREGCINWRKATDSINGTMSDAAQQRTQRLFGIDVLLFESKENILKGRLLSIPQFKTMYDNIYAEIKKITVESSFTRDFSDEWNEVFLKYNKDEKRFPEIIYLGGLWKLVNYFENMKNS